MGSPVAAGDGVSLGDARRRQAQRECAEARQVRLSVEVAQAGRSHRASARAGGRR